MLFYMEDHNVPKYVLTHPVTVLGVPWEYSVVQMDNILSPKFMRSAASEK